MAGTYRTIAEFAQQFGVLYFFGAFLVVLAYALAPSRKAQFDEAARTPLRED